MSRAFHKEEIVIPIHHLGILATGPSDPGPARDQLRVAAGDIAALADEHGARAREYQPVTAIAVGAWTGHPAAYRETVPNRCVLLHATGDVFDF
jgi:hypothetical protein